MIREVVLRIKGFGGFLGVDVVGFRRILVCKFFKRLSINLCDFFVILMKRFCIEYVDLLIIEFILVSCFILLDKGNGEVCLIGVGEVIRRIIGKCVFRVGK